MTTGGGTQDDNQGVEKTIQNDNPGKKIADNYNRWEAYRKG